MTGQWNCNGLIVTFFQDGCLATSKNNEFILEVIGNNVTNIGEQFKGVKATVNELRTEMKSSKYFCNKSTGNYENTTEIPRFSVKRLYLEGDDWQNVNNENVTEI